MTTMQRAFPAPVIPKFFTNNICGNYQIRRFFNGQDDFICAQGPFHTQTIASQSEEGAAASSLAIAFANIDENDKKQVLAFCNAYGRPYSSQRCLEKRAHLDDENHSVIINDFSFIDTTLFMGDILVEKDYAANDAEVTLNYTLFEVDEMDIMSLRLCPLRQNRPQPAYCPKLSLPTRRDTGRRYLCTCLPATLQRTWHSLPAAAHRSTYAQNCRILCYAQAYFAHAAAQKYPQNRCRLRLPAARLSRSRRQAYAAHTC